VSTRYLDVKAAAAYLGRSEHAVRHLVKKRQIPYIRKQGRVFFDQHSLDRWMGAGAVPVI